MFSTRRYPQENEQVEATHKIILDNLVKKVEAYSKPGKTVAKGTMALWTYRTTPKKPIRESTFTLTYGTEAVIQTEMKVPTTRIDLVQTINIEDILFQEFGYS